MRERDNTWGEEEGGGGEGVKGRRKGDRKRDI